MLLPNYELTAIIEVKVKGDNNKTTEYVYLYSAHILHSTRRLTNIKIKKK